MFSSTGKLFIYIAAGLGIIIVISIFSRKSPGNERKQAVHLQGNNAGLSFFGGSSNAQSYHTITPSSHDEGSFPQPLQSPSKTAGNQLPPSVYSPSK